MKVMYVGYVERGIQCGASGAAGEVYLRELDWKEFVTTRAGSFLCFLQFGLWSVRFLCTETTSTSTTTAAVTVGTGTVETTTASTSIFKLLTIIFSVLVGLGLLWILLLFCCLYVWYPPGWRRGGVIVRRRYVTADPYGTSDPYNRGYPPVRSQRPFPPYSNVIAPGTPAPMPNYYWDIGDETFRPILDGLLAMYSASRRKKLGRNCIFCDSCVKCEVIFIVLSFLWSGVTTAETYWSTLRHTSTVLSLYLVKLVTFDIITDLTFGQQCKSECTRQKYPALVNWNKINFFFK